MDDSIQRSDPDEFIDDASGQPLPASPAQPTSAATTAAPLPASAPAAPPASRVQSTWLRTPGRIIIGMAVAASLSTMLTARIVLPTHGHHVAPVVHGPMDRWPGVIHLVEGDVLKIPVVGPATPVNLEITKITADAVTLRPIDPTARVRFVVE